MQQDGDAWRRRKRPVSLGKGRSLAVVDTGGEGPAIILLHGYTDTSRSYQALASHMHGFRLIMPDLPGHGDSDEDPQADLSTLAEDIEALAAALQIVPALVIGHSFGSLLTLELARRRTWPRMKLVLIAGSARPMLTGLEALAPIRHFRGTIEPDDPFLDRWYSGPASLDMHFLQRMRIDAVKMPVRVWHHYLTLLEATDFQGALRQIDNPVLSISGGRDDLFDSRHADALCGALPDIEDIRLADSGHNPHWEAPAQVAGIIANWLHS